LDCNFKIYRILNIVFFFIQPRECVNIKNNETAKAPLLPQPINKNQSTKPDQLPASVSHKTQSKESIPSAISSIPVQSGIPFFQLLKEMSSIKHIAFDPVDVKIAKKNLTKSTIYLVINCKFDALNQIATNAFDKNDKANQDVFKIQGNKFQKALNSPLSSTATDTNLPSNSTVTEAPDFQNLRFVATGFSKSEARLNATVKALRHLLFLKGFFSDRQLKMICSCTCDLLAKHREETGVPLIEYPQCISFLTVLNEIGLIKHVTVGNFFDHKCRKFAVRVDFLFNGNRENFYCHGETEEAARLWGSVCILKFFLGSASFVSLLCE
jgi:hypothetical protein